MVNLPSSNVKNISTIRKTFTQCRHVSIHFGLHVIGQTEQAYDTSHMLVEEVYARNCHIFVPSDKGITERHDHIPSRWRYRCLPVSDSIAIRATLMGAFMPL